MSSLRVCFIIFFMINLLAAQTVIEDGAHVSGTWTLSGSPYLIRGEAIVDEDSLLQIEPGVEIRFKTGSQSDYLDPAFDLAFLRIDGKLTAQGSADQPIVFTRDGAEGNWGILFFDQTADSSSTLKFCRIEYASHILHLLDWLEYSGAVSVNGTQVTLEQCRISRNTKDGLFAHNGSFRVTNSLIARNGANGLVAASDARLQVSNVTLTGNSENGIAMGLNSSLSVSNSIFWNNGGSLSGNASSTMDIGYSLIQEESLPADAQNLGGNLFGRDPQFADTSADNYSLRSNSFCINAGTPDTSGSQIGATDLDGQARIVHDRIDMGAFEFSGDYLRVTSPDDQDSWKIGTTQTIRWYSNLTSVRIEFSADSGATWSEITASTENDGAYQWTIPNSPSERCLIRISDAADSDPVDVSDGLFFISDVTIIPDGSRVFGTWSKLYSPFVVRGTAVVPTDSTLTIEPGVVVRFNTGEQHVFTSSEFDLGMLKVEGTLMAQGSESDSIYFTRDGSDGYWGLLFFDKNTETTSLLKYAVVSYASFVDSLVDSLSYEGAVSCRSASPEISHCRFDSNQKSGLQLTENSSPTVAENALQNNGHHGLLLSNAGVKGKPGITKNRVRQNAADGIHIEGTFYADIEQNRIEQNTGHGIYNASGYATVRVANNFITGNNVGIFSSGSMEAVGNLISENNTGVQPDGGEPQLMNNTFVQNTTAIYCQNSSPYVTNCLFNQNGKDFNHDAGDDSQPVVSYSLFDAGYLDSWLANAGFNLMGQQPQFTGTAPHPYALKSTSPAIERGTMENELVTLPDSDLAGKPRIYDGNNDGTAVIDIGAYEFSALTADFVADTTLGEYPFIVQFENRSVGEIDSLKWYFGDGDSSTADSPSHTYTRNGHFTVQLKVFGALGVSAKERPDYIVVESRPVVRQPVADTNLTEDCGRQMIAFLDSVFSDPDSGDALRFSMNSANLDLGATLSNDTLWIRPTENYFGSGEIILQASDPYGLTANDTVRITIAPVNDAPEILSSFPDSLKFPTDSTSTIFVWDYVQDVESAPRDLTYHFEVTNDSLLFQFADTSGVLTLSAEPDYTGRCTLYVTVIDDSNATATDSCLVDVFAKTETEINGLSTQPEEFRLEQNYPNPFNPVTTIRYHLAAQGDNALLPVRLEVFNLLGKSVALLVDERQRPGTYTVTFDGSNLVSGVYFFKLTAGKFSAVRKMILLR